MPIELFCACMLTAIATGVWLALYMRDRQGVEGDAFTARRDRKYHLIEALHCHAAARPSPGDYELSIDHTRHIVTVAIAFADHERASQFRTYVDALASTHRTHAIYRPD